MTQRSNHNKLSAPLLLAALLFALLLPTATSAQSKGHLGKRFILRTTAINGIQKGFNNFEAEWVLGRRVSVNLFFENINYSRSEKGVSRRTGSVNPRNGMGEYRETSVLKNGTTKGPLFGAGFKLYFNSIIPAPYGFYTSLFVGYGNVTFSEFDVSYTYKEKNTSVDVDKIRDKPEVKGLSGESTLYTIDFPSIGFQRIFKGIVVLDMRLSGLTQYSALPDNLLNAFEHNYFVRSNTVSYGYGNFSIGLSANIKLGILIF